LEQRFVGDDTTNQLITAVENVGIHFSALFLVLRQLKSNRAGTTIAQLETTRFLCEDAELRASTVLLSARIHHLATETLNIRIGAGWLLASMIDADAHRESIRPLLPSHV
jgi:hypothetical protein